MQGQNTPLEEWRAIPDWEGLYSISSLGRIRREIDGTGTRAGRILKASCLYRGSRASKTWVSPLVLMAQVFPDTNHEWRSVAEFEGLYEVSRDGLVRCIKSHGCQRSRPVTQHANHAGYMMVWLYKKPKAYGRFVHRLVATAFIGPRPEGLQVNHKDGAKEHNDAANLEYVTQEENMAHAIRIGLDKKRLRNKRTGRFTSYPSTAV